MSITTAVRTDCGKVRPRNEDAFGLFPDLQTYVVADGMGGQRGGTLASTLAVETIRHTLLDTDVQVQTPSPTPLPPSQPLLNAVYRAHTQVLEVSHRQLELLGMGTTVAAVAFDSSQESAVICHVGNTRVYRLREAVLEQLTEDHTVAQQFVRAGLMSPQEWRTSRYRHVLTQAIGVGPEVHPEPCGLKLHRLRTCFSFVVMVCIATSSTRRSTPSCGRQEPTYSKPVTCWWS